MDYKSMTDVELKKFITRYKLFGHQLTNQEEQREALEVLLERVRNEAYEKGSQDRFNDIDLQSE